MKKIDTVLSAILAISGFLTLAVDEVFKPFLDGYPEVKLIITLASVLSAYHTLLTFSIHSTINEEIEKTNIRIEELSLKVDFFQKLIPYSKLDEIEFQHGCSSRNKKNITCEMWIIANTLQESKNDDSMIRAIYDNITKNGVCYYYVLPDTRASIVELSNLKSRLNEFHKEKRRRITGTIQYRLDDKIANMVAAEYYDIVLYIDCDENGQPSTLGDSQKCEGFQCYSNSSSENDYFYQRIVDTAKIIDIRAFHLAFDFETIEIGG